MKKLSTALFCLFLASAQLFASHIVGGELFLRFKSGNTYTLGLNMYYDEINASSPALKQDFIRVTIFRKSDNAFIQNVDLGYFKSQELITYKNPSCQQYNKVKTSRLLYYVDVVLSPDTFNDAGGYYAVWERCCRNNVISNIQNPDQIGNVFYLEFPAVTRNDTNFRNSSPQFSLITGDYACVNSPFFFAFGGTDPDGDSLVYSLETPYKGYSVACVDSRFNQCSCPDNCSYPANPLNGPGNVVDPNAKNHAAPYPQVSWSSGYSLQKSTPGPQPLRVDSRTGVVTFTTNLLGIYAFAVRCDEYRNGVKIGTVQRDFQINVIDCPKNYPPVIRLKDNKTRQYVSRNAVIQVKKTDSLCFDVAFSNRISGTVFSSSTLNAQVIATNFPARLVSLSPTSGTVYKDTDTLRAKLCFDKCAAAETNQPLQLKLVVGNDGCGGGLADTLSVSFNFELLVQQPPVVSTTLPGNRSSIFVRQVLKFEVLANNPQKGTLSLYGVGRGFNLKDVGMQFENGKTGTDSLRVPFTWTPDCSQLEQVKDNAFIIDFFAQNQNCKNKTDTSTVVITLQDSVVNYTFLPVNLFTPNGDNYNDAFKMSEDADISKNLPPDNCSEKFERIEIFNRWGKSVFISHDRHFRWEASHFPPGSYFYLIFYTSKKFKGWVSLVK